MDHVKAEANTVGLFLVKLIAIKLIVQSTLYLFIYLFWVKILFDLATSH